ncbi:MAG: hypothetical protein LAO24_07255 [Acidobacteriia bacterium]|nr:hypothetical protein [Terriglobia bacterium]
MTAYLATIRRLLLTTACVALLGSAACNRQTGTPAAPFPAPGEVAGWVKAVDVRTFPAADLWNYIDGEAERYVKAGVRSTSTADYKFQNKFDAVVDIYTMADTAGARKILESEPAGEAKSVQLGDGARLYAASLIFIKGPCLVRIVAYKESPDVQQALMDLGRGIEGKLSK